jgi:hypothetical protein
MAQRIEDLDKRIEQLRARRQKLVARESVKARSLRTRQAVIIGTWIMGNPSKPPMNRPGIRGGWLG